MVSVRTFPSAASSARQCSAFSSVSALTIKTPSYAPSVQVPSFDFHAGLRGDLVERVGALGRFLDFFGALFGETQKANISSHKFSNLELFWNNPVMAAGAARLLHQQF